jgi:hypothetical protein
MGISLESPDILDFEKGESSHVIIHPDIPTPPRFCTPQITDQGQPQTSNISEHPQHVSPHARPSLCQLATMANLMKINPKMSPSSVPKSSHQTIDSLSRSKWSLVDM